jgi:hypothetical protein
MCFVIHRLHIIGTRSYMTQHKCTLIFLRTLHDVEERWNIVFASKYDRDSCVIIWNGKKDWKFEKNIIKSFLNCWRSRLHSLTICVWHEWKKNKLNERTSERANDQGLSIGFKIYFNALICRVWKKRLASQKEKLSDKDRKGIEAWTYSQWWLI